MAKFRGEFQEFKDNCTIAEMARELKKKNYSKSKIELEVARETKKLILESVNNTKREITVKRVVNDSGNINERVVKTNFVESRDIKKLFNVVDLSKVWDIMSKSYISIMGKNSFFLGLFPAKIGERPWKIARPYPSPLVYFYFNKLFEEKFPNVRPFDFLQISGGATTNSASLQEAENLSVKHPKICDEYFERMRPVIIKFVKKLKIKDLVSPTINDLNFVHVNPTSYPGIRWREFFKFQSKGSALPYILPAAMQLYKQIASGKATPASLWAIGDRNKREDEFTNTVELSSRCVHMPEVQSEVVSSLYMTTIIRYFKSMTCFPIYLGWSASSFGYNRLVDDVSFGLAGILEGDWKKFDTTIPVVKLILAFATASCYFRENKINSRMFEYFLTTILTKSYVLPGGYIFRISSMLPSGTAWTAVINSIVNFWNLCEISHYVLRIEKSGDVRFVIGGDDFLLCMRKGIRAPVKYISSWCEEHIGMVLKPSATAWKNWNTTDPLEMPVFYKIGILNGLPTTPPRAFVDRLLAPMSIFNKGFTLSRFLKDMVSAPLNYTKYTDWLVDVYCIHEGFKNKDGLVSLINSNFEKIFMSFSGKPDLDSAKGVPLIGCMTDEVDQNILEAVLMCFSEDVSLQRKNKQTYFGTNNIRIQKKASNLYYSK